MPDLGMTSWLILEGAFCSNLLQTTKLFWTAYEESVFGLHFIPKCISGLKGLLKFREMYNEINRKK